MMADAGTARTWVLEFEPGMPILTANNRKSRYPKAKAVRGLSDRAVWKALEKRLPQIEYANILVTYQPPPRRLRDRHPFASERIEDAENLGPTSKALIDGLVRAGAFASDSRKHIRRVSYELLPGTHPRGQVTMRITEIPREAAQ
jgi:hypothetical protein